MATTTQDKPKRKTKRKRTRKGTDYGIPPELLDTLLLIPGYDCRRDAGECRFDPEAAAMAVEFFHECLKHVKGAKAGQPFILEPWQQAIVLNLYGWKRPDGTRRYRRCLIYVGKKNGKTALAAGLVLLSLMVDHEPGAEIYGAAAAKDQAALVFSQVVGMIKQEEMLTDRLRVYGAKGGSVTKAVHYEEEGSSYKVISADSDTADGVNVHFAVVDELHRFRTREFLDVIDSSTVARRQPLRVAITTADYARPSPCNDEHKYACDVRDGRITDATYLPVIYECSREDDWTDPAVWAKANPNLGVSVPESYLQELCEKAQHQPSFLNTFKRLHLNIVTEAAVAWLEAHVWAACGMDPPVLPRDREDLRGRDVWLGLDLSSTVDTTSLAGIFPRPIERQEREEDDDTEPQQDFDVVVWTWIPRENAAEREKRDRVPYLTWANQGWLELTNGNSVDYGLIRKRIRQLADVYNIREIAYDPWNARHLVTELGEDDGFQVVEVRQGYQTLNEPSKLLEALLADGRLHHDGNPVLAWQAGNVSVKTDPAGNIKPDKATSTERIDGIAALVTALARAMLGQGDGRSVYEEHGIRFI